jgi:hypothetical protein
MSRKTGLLNKHQKKAFRKGEPRVSGESIQELLELSRSSAPEDRRFAAEFLCPCHVRRRIGEVWEALFIMLEDPDLKVRKAAFHTLEDGGKPDDPVLKEIFERASNDPDPKIRSQAQRYLSEDRIQERLADRLATQSEYPERGKCDFCGISDTDLRKDFDTEIPDGVNKRLALVCKTYDS